MLIIEGTDCVGKTTLAKRLSSELGLLYQHLGPLPEGWHETDYIKLGCQKVVYDRFHISELVYSTALGRPTVIENPLFLHAALGVRFGAFTVVICAEPELINLRYKAEAQLFNLKQVLECNTLFAKCAPRYADLIIRTSVTNPYANDVDVRNIIAGWGKKQECQESWRAILKSST